MKVTRKRFLGGMAAVASMGWRAFGASARKQRGATDTTWWDPYVENITDVDTYLRRKFRQDVTDRATGLDVPGLKKLHPSVCSGEKGLGVMRTLVEMFHRNGGSVIQFTVFCAEELRDAQAHPEKYENLQVRVCGWNVRWNDMSKVEQDAYIRRAENVMQGF